MEELKSAVVMEDELMKYLRNSNGEIFEIIKKAITMAASDHPQEFQNKRGMIAQTLFSYEDEKTTVAQVLKIKQVLDDQSNSQESVLFESLLKLQYMVKSVNVLKVTGVGISVNTLRKHASTKRVVDISTTLVKEWKCMVDKWMKDNENPKNPPQIKKQLPVPESSDEKRSLIVRIKLKKVEPNSPETPEQKVGNDKDDGVTRVLRIKEILDDVNVSESVVLESLMKLLEMSLSVKTLQETRIGDALRALLKKHGSKDVRQIAWGLVKKWDGMVDDQYIKKESSLKTERKVGRVELEGQKKRMKEGIDQEKIEAAKRKMVEEIEKIKKKRRIQVIEDHEFSKKGFSAKIKPPLRRKIRRVVC